MSEGGGTHLGRTEVLDGAGIGVAYAYFPCLALLGKLEEWRTVKLYESLADNGLHVAVTTLHVHHHGDGPRLAAL